MLYSLINVHDVSEQMHRTLYACMERQQQHLLKQFTLKFAAIFFVKVIRSRSISFSFDQWQPLLRPCIAVECSKPERMVVKKKMHRVILKCAVQNVCIYKSDIIASVVIKIEREKPSMHTREYGCVLCVSFLSQEKKDISEQKRN